MEKIKVLELFGGIGACTKAFKRLGIPFEVVDYVEIDESAVKSYNAINNTNFKPQDIKQWDKDIDVDFIMHGSPCTNFSLAGKQEGGDEGSGTASSLMYETLRIIDKLKPQYVIWENVANLLSEKHRQNHQKYLDIMNNLGYNNYYEVLNAKDYGISQNRNRVFTVSIRKDIDNKEFHFNKKQLLTKSYKDVLQDDYDKQKVVLTEDDMRKVRSHEGCEVDYGFGGYILANDEITYPTITASYGKVSGNSGKIACKEGYRILTPKECWRLMGFDDEDYEKASQVNSSKSLYKQAGNSIVVNVMQSILVNLFNITNNNYEYRIYKYHNVIDNVVRALLEPKKIDDDGNACIEFWDKYGSFFLTIENYSDLENVISSANYTNGLVPHIAIKILEIALIKLSETSTKKEAKQLEIDITEIIQMLESDVTNIKNKQKQQKKDYFRRQIRIALQILKNVKIKFKQVPTSGYTKMNICKSTTKLPSKSSKESNNKKVSVEMTNTVHFEFSDELLNLLVKDGKDIALPLEIIQYDEKYDKHYYLIYKKLLSAIETNNEAKLAVLDLYKYCVTLQRIGDVSKKNRDYSNKIRKPIEKVLDSINEFEWKYVDRNPISFREWLYTSIIIKRNIEQRKDIKVA